MSRGEEGHRVLRAGLDVARGDSKGWSEQAIGGLCREDRSRRWRERGFGGSGGMRREW